MQPAEAAVDVLIALVDINGLSLGGRLLWDNISYLLAASGIQNSICAALPKRGTEVEAWREAAQSLLMSLQDGSDEEARTRPGMWLQTNFGPPERLNGKEDPACHGCLIDITISRVLPCTWNAQDS